MQYTLSAHNFCNNVKTQWLVNRVTMLTCRQTGCGGRGAGGWGVYGYCCFRFCNARMSCGGERQAPRGQRLAPFQQLFVLLLAKARGHLSGQVTLLEQSLGLLCCLWLTSRRNTLAISSAWGCRWDSTGVQRGKRGRFELGRIWHCWGGRVVGDKNKSRSAGMKEAKSMRQSRVVESTFTDSAAFVIIFDIYKDKKKWHVFLESWRGMVAFGWGP